MKSTDEPESTGYPVDEVFSVSTIDPIWQQALSAFRETKIAEGLLAFLRTESQQYAIYPIASNVFRALKLTAVHEVKVVILGQDPYHGTGQADGLSFSVPNQMALPPSLRNIFKELQADLGIKRSQSDLTDWAKQGVLLLNTSLTVRKATAGSHRRKGWLPLTDRLLQIVSEKASPCVFILWGKDAIAKQQCIDGKRHCILTSVHPSPLSAYRGFFGSQPFSKANQFLLEKNRTVVQW